MFTQQRRFEDEQRFNYIETVSRVFFVVGFDGTSNNTKDTGNEGLESPLDVKKQTKNACQYKHGFNKENFQLKCWHKT